MRDTTSIRHITPSTRRWRTMRDWLVPLVMTGLCMAALWFLPLQFESKKPHHPKPLRLTLSFLTPAPQPPKPQIQKPKPVIRKPQPRKVVKKRRVRRKRRIRRRRRRKVLPKRRVVPRPVPRPVIARREPPPAPPRPVVQKVAKVSRPVPRPVVRPRPIVQQKKPKPVNLGPYRSFLGQSIARHKRYPRIAARMGMQGLVVVLIRISKKGSLVGNPKIVRSSGHGMLDKEALRMIVAAAPFRSMPNAYQQGSATFRLPINFKLADEDS